MADLPQVELIRRGYAAFASGDMATLNDMFADDIEWTIPGRSPISGTRKGKAEVFDFFGQLAALSENTFALEMIDLLGSDDHVVALVHESAHRGEQRLDNDATHIWQVRDGKVVSFAAHNSDQYADDEFYS
jgi:ketosteroid isomerase-like protein